MLSFSIFKSLIPGLIILSSLTLSQTALSMQSPGGEQGRFQEQRIILIKDYQEQGANPLDDDHAVLVGYDQATNSYRLPAFDGALEGGDSSANKLHIYKDNTASVREYTKQQVLGLSTYRAIPLVDFIEGVQDYLDGNPHSFLSRGDGHGNNRLPTPLNEEDLSRFKKGFQLTKKIISDQSHFKVRIIISAILDNPTATAIGTQIFKRIKDVTLKNLILDRANHYRPFLHITLGYMPITPSFIAYSKVEEAFKGAKVAPALKAIAPQLQMVGLTPHLFGVQKRFMAITADDTTNPIFAQLHEALKIPLVEQNFFKNNIEDHPNAVGPFTAHLSILNVDKLVAEHPEYTKEGVESEVQAAFATYTQHANPYVLAPGKVGISFNKIILSIHKGNYKLLGKPVGDGTIVQY